MNPSIYFARTIHRHTIHSAALGEERTAIVYLPPGYDELQTYPSIYCQDGEQFFNFGRIATQATKLILDENLQPPIIVGIVVNTAARNDEYHPEGSRFEAYESFLTEELLPFIENNYPVRRSPDERIAAGDSLGGTVSLHLALNHPELFHRIVSLSGAFYEPTQQRLANEQDLSWLKMYAVVGTEETEVKTHHGIYNFLEMNRKAKALLEEKHAVLEYKELSGTHTWGFWQKELPGALKHFLG